jgi:hypothetical protein
VPECVGAVLDEPVGGVGNIIRHGIILFMLDWMMVSREAARLINEEYRDAWTDTGTARKGFPKTQQSWITSTLISRIRFTHRPRYAF